MADTIPTLDTKMIIEEEINNPFYNFDMLLNYLQSDDSSLPLSQVINGAMDFPDDPLSNLIHDHDYTPSHHRLSSSSSGGEGLDHPDVSTLGLPMPSSATTGFSSAALDYENSTSVLAPHGLVAPKLLRLPFGFTNQPGHAPLPMVMIGGSIPHPTLPVSIPVAFPSHGMVSPPISTTSDNSDGPYPGSTSSSRRSSTSSTSSVTSTSSTDSKRASKSIDASKTRPKLKKGVSVISKGRGRPRINVLPQLDDPIKRKKREYHQNYRAAKDERVRQEVANGYDVIMGKIMKLISCPSDREKIRSILRQNGINPVF